MNYFCIAATTVDCKSAIILLPSRHDPSGTTYADLDHWESNYRHHHSTINRNQFKDVYWKFRLQRINSGEFQVAKKRN